MLQELTPEEVFRRLQADEIRLVDIRDPQEIVEKSIDGALLAPLSVVDQQQLQANTTTPKDIVFFCNSGRRTNTYASQLAALPNAKYQMQGGISAWEKAGLPMKRGEKLPMSIFRQVQIGAGALVLLGSIGSMLWSPLLWLAVFVGAGLLFAGVSGFCGLAIILGRMPWNKPR